MSLTIGSLCSGYGGLDLAVERFYGARTIWHAEIDPAMSKVLAARWPGVPNLGNLKLIHYGRVPRVDIVTAGYPCQPFSHAGRRGGVDDPRHLWPYVAQAVRRVRPRLVVSENVAGHRSLGFGDVLGDLAALGYDVRWTSLRAADVGAPHGRERVFIIAADTVRERLARPEHATAGRSAPTDTVIGCRDAATDTQSNAGRVGDRDSGTSADPSCDGWDEGRTEPARIIGGSDAAVRSAAAPDPERGGWREDDSRGRDLVGQRCIQAGRDESASAHRSNSGTTGTRWGNYEPAIRRWERLTRPAPALTETGPKGGQRLSPAFVEWMMGLPAGWVTDVPGLTRNDMLRGTSSGVVPQQAVEALRRLNATAFEAVA